MKKLLKLIIFLEIVISLLAILWMLHINLAWMHQNAWCRIKVFGLKVNEKVIFILPYKLPKSCI